MKTCNHVMIISGGTCDRDLVKHLVNKHAIDTIIAVDGGLKIVDDLNLVPNYIVGDFDTISSEVIAKYQQVAKDPDSDITIMKFRPEKDDTDSEIAIRLCIDLKPKKVFFVGATGTRLDHTFANLHLLKVLLDAKIDAAIYDKNNKIYLVDDTRRIKKADLYGPYFSMLPFTEKVGGITLRGFKYPLNRKDITSGTSLCISNEVIEEEGTLEFDSGILIIFESCD